MNTIQVLSTQSPRSRTRTQTGLTDAFVSPFSRARFGLCATTLLLSVPPLSPSGPRPDELTLVASASLASHSQVLKESKFKEHGRITPGASAGRTFRSERGFGGSDVAPVADALKGKESSRSTARSTSSRAKRGCNFSFCLTGQSSLWCCGQSGARET